MNIFKEPHNPNWFRLSELDNQYDYIYTKYISVQIGQEKLHWGKASIPLLSLAASIGLSFLWLPALLVNVLTILVWTLVPSVRPIQQLTRRYRIQKGQNGVAKYYGPRIDWALCKHNELYAMAVYEWLEALRSSGTPSINLDDWNKYLRETANLVPKNDSRAKPDFEKIKILKEIM